MVKYYPEIERFFIRDSFSNEDLDNLKEDLKTKYSKYEYRSVLSLINLDLKKFELANKRETQKFKEETKVRLLNPEKSTKNQKLNHVAKEDSKPIGKINLEKLSIQEFCNKLEVNLSLVNKILREKTLLKFRKVS